LKTGGGWKVGGGNGTCCELATIGGARYRGISGSGYRSGFSGGAGNSCDSDSQIGLAGNLFFSSGA